MVRNVLGLIFKERFLGIEEEAISIFLCLCCHAFPRLCALETCTQNEEGGEEEYYLTYDDNCFFILFCDFFYSILC